ncbi:MAG: M12 family metallopeptidase [Oligoflexales bacterium]
MKNMYALGIALASFTTSSTYAQDFFDAEQLKDPTYGEYENAADESVDGDPDIQVLNDELLQYIIEDQTGSYDEQRFLAGDTVMTGAELRKIHSPDRNFSAEVCSQRRVWPRGVIPYDDSGVGSSDIRSRIARAAGVWGKYGITWRKRTSRDTSYVKFQTTAKGCWADIGYAGGRRTINLGNNCYTQAVILHEMGHTMGLYHEQVRPDRDNFVIVKMQNVQRGQEHNFTKQGCYDSSISYDYRSIMHYSSYAFAKRPGLKTIVKRDGTTIQRGSTLTTSDVKTLKRLYSDGFLAGEE